jgi:hypothetical protein
MSLSLFVNGLDVKAGRELSQFTQGNFRLLAGKTIYERPLNGSVLAEVVSQVLETGKGGRDIVGCGERLQGRKVVRLTVRTQKPGPGRLGGDVENPQVTEALKDGPPELLGSIYGDFLHPGNGHNHAGCALWRLFAGSLLIRPA